MRRLLVLACAVIFLEVTFFAVLTPLLPVYRRELGLSEGEAGILAGSFAAGTLVMALPAGWFASRFGPRKAVIIGLVGVGIFSTIFGFAERIELLDASRFFQGAAGAFMWAGAISWVVSAAPRERRGQVMGTVIAAAVVGELMGAPIGALAYQVGTEIIFSLVLVASAILIVWAMTIPPVAEVAGQPVRDAIAVVRRAQLGKTLVVLAGPSAAFGLVVVLGPLRLDDLGATPWMIAAAFVTGSLTEAIVGPIIGRVSDRVGRKIPYLFGLLVMAVAIAILGLFQPLALILVSVVLIAFGAGLAFTPATALITDLATSAGLNQGYASGGANVGWAGGQMIGAFGGGLLAGAYGYLLPALLTVVVLGLTALVARRTEEPRPGSLSEAGGIV